MSPFLFVVTMEVILKAAEGSAGPARLSGRCSMPPVKAFIDGTTITYHMYKVQHAKKFNRFHLCCLRKLLKVSWQDKVPVTEILEQSGMPSVFTLLQQTLLCWAGHVIRMSVERLPKRILYGELQSGARSHGGQMKIFKDTLKASMKDFNFDLTLWEALAQNRSAWCGSVIKGVKTYEQQRLQQRANEQHKRPWPTVTQLLRLQLRHGLAPTTTETLGLGLASSATSKPTDNPTLQMTTDEDGHILQRRTNTSTPILLTACRFCSDWSCTSVASQMQNAEVLKKRTCA
ncbi:hypothetical protein ElyMa_006799100 [Elysia marginata]|uniref:Uncharacterized protein n=1 Tax=Elysia marginata TaxID=1093978 RepID=A0AAV4J2J8_9GAST|nr:hypothetical protein ElyMa_006799100 [Elysia marginata]